MTAPDVPTEITDHYEVDFDESDRILSGLNELELVRTREIIERYLPPSGRVLDIGGAAGVHARWLAERGHHVDLVDPMPRHVDAACELAGEGLSVTASLGDARALTQPDQSYDAVLLLGPLYHLTEPADRLTAWREALRVAKPGAPIFAAGISRFASLFSGFAFDLLFAIQFRAIIERDLREGQHRNPDRHPDWFTTAYFHHPDELGEEARAAGASVVTVVGVEGMAAWQPGLAHRWAEPEARDAIVAAARSIESEPTLLGLSPHLLLVARRPA